ncbi:MAG: ABC-2 family transporter protein [Thermoleophilia bacterium]|nr:ABC-2 family transporter protein [Thermoleophilia bacterium]
MAEAAAAFGVYRRLVGARIRSQLQYRLSFALSVTGVALVTFLDFAVILVIFGQIDALAGWSVAEVAFLYAVSSLAFALTDLAIGHLDLLPRMIRKGDLDAMLTRPLGSLFQVVAADFALRRLGRVLQALVVLAVAIALLEIPWTAGRVAMLVVMVVAGAAIFAGVWIAFATIAFWLVDSMEVANAFTYGGSFLGQYPIAIFGAWLRRFVIFVVPIAFVAYFPSLYVLDKPDTLGMPAALQVASPLVGAVSLLAGWLVWQNAVRHYRSTGS